MKLDLELQYAEFHPDQVHKIGEADLEQTLKVIYSFPWDREFEKIEKRTKEDLTSTVPSISIKNKSNELLTISARNKNNFIAELITPTHHGELMVSNNSFENKQGLSIEIIVERFYKGTANKVFKLKKSVPSRNDNSTVYKLRDYPIFISALIAGILLLILIFDFISNGFTLKALPAIYFVGFIILFLGLETVLTLQYIIADWGKEISFGQDRLIIKQKGNEFEIKKNDIDQVVIVGNDKARRMKSYKYARIKTKDDKVFVVTSFTVEPIQLIVNKLRINYKEESVFLPLIRLGLLSEKQRKIEILKNKKFREKKKIEFIENFKNYDDSKLKEIIRSKENYADYAVDAASELLKNREK